MRTVAEAIRAGRRESIRPTADYEGLCLKAVRQFWGLPGGWPDADAAWAAVPDSHRHGGTAPAGAAIFWAVGAHGHVALGLGHGFCLTTDLRRKGKIDAVPTALITNVWRADLRGWASWLNGEVLPL